MKTVLPFNQYGFFQGHIPAECVEDCTQPGQDASGNVDYWLSKLSFDVPRDLAIRYLAEFGAWPRKSDDYHQGLEDMTDSDLAAKVLWIACGDIKEHGQWAGLVH